MNLHSQCQLYFEKKIILFFQSIYRSNQNIPYKTWSRIFNRVLNYNNVPCWFLFPVWKRTLKILNHTTWIKFSMIKLVPLLYLSLFATVTLHCCIHFLDPRISNTAADVGLEASVIVFAAGGESEVYIWEVLPLNLLHVMVQPGKGEGLAMRLVHAKHIR